MRLWAIVGLLVACAAHAYPPCDMPWPACQMRERALQEIRNANTEGLARVLGEAAAVPAYRPGALEIGTAIRAGTRIVHGIAGTAPTREDKFGVAVRLKMIRLLVEAGADVNERSDYLQTSPAFDVPYESDAAILEFLLSKGARTKATDFGHSGYPMVRSVLSTVLSWKDEKVVARMLPEVLKRGADVNEPLSNGRTILMGFSASGRPDRVALLIKNGAQVNPQDVEGRNALMAAAGAGDLGAVQLLLKAGAQVGAADTGGATALHHAAHHAPVIRLLIKSGASPTARDLLGGTPLHWLAQSAPIPDYRRLAGKPAEERSRLEAEVRTARVEAAKTLAALGAGVGEKNVHGVTPLHLVTFAQMADALIDAGADVRTVNAYGYTALHSSWNRSPEVALALLRRGADIHAAAAEGVQFLHLAAQNGHARPAVAEAIAKGARVNARTQSGRTPLHYALASYCDPDMVRLLLEKGADARIEDRAGDTAALLWAANAEFDHEGRCRKALEDGGIDLKARGSRGVSPLELASRPRPQREGWRPGSLTIPRY